MATKLKSTSKTSAKISEKKIPRSWLRALGLLKKKHINALGYQKKKRAEWDK